MKTLQKLAYLGVNKNILKKSLHSIQYKRCVLPAKGRELKMIFFTV